jgi:ADP-heptose:LPS heptosyltransferase
MNFREINRRKNLTLRSLKAHVGKLLFDKKNENTFVTSKIKEIKKIVYLRNDGKLGDMIISTLAFRGIKKQLPQAKVYVITTKAAAEIIKNNPYVDKIYFCGKGFWEILKCGVNLRKEKIDLFIDIDEKPIWQTFLLIRLISPRLTFGFNRQNCGIYNINSNIAFNSAHITHNHKEVFKTLGLNEPALNYDIFIPKELKDKAQKFVDNLPENKKIIAINPFAASRHKNLTFAQVSAVARGLKEYNFILIGEGKTVNDFLKNKEIPDNLFSPFAKDSLNFTFALISQCDYIITPDTSVLHAAVAFGKPLLGIYHGNEESNFMKVWSPGPNSGKYRIFLGGTEFSEIPTDRIIREFVALVGS